MPNSPDDAQLATRVRRMFDTVLNERHVESIGDFIAEDVVDHSPAPGQVAGRAGIEQMVGVLLGANPALRVTVDDVIVQGNRVAVRETWETVNGVQHIAHFFRFAGERIVEEWSMGWGDPPAPPEQEASPPVST
jgi:predicted SnoaL-like aldol condensation-catalyzing enzyme